MWYAVPVRIMICYPIDNAGNFLIVGVQWLGKMIDLNAPHPVLPLCRVYDDSPVEGFQCSDLEQVQCFQVISRCEIPELEIMLIRNQGVVAILKFTHHSTAVRLKSSLPLFASIAPAIKALKIVSSIPPSHRRRNSACLEPLPPVAQSANGKRSMNHRAVNTVGGGKVVDSSTA